MSITTIASLNLVIFFMTLIVNGLGSNGFANGKSQAELSKKYQTNITPNNFAFSIWGVIYVLLFITLVYLFWQRNEPAAAEIIRSISNLFIGASLLNMGWIVAFSYEKMGISTIFIFGMMLALMSIIGRLQSVNPSFARTIAGLSFTLYASWVLIATFINIAVFLIKKEWNGFGLSDSFWTISILSLAIIFVVTYVFVYQNAIFPLAIAWAFYGINSAYREGKVEPARASTIQSILRGSISLFLILIVSTFILNGWAIFPT